MSGKQFFTRAGIVSAVLGVGGLLGTGVASAHVTANVYGEQPAKGGYGAIALRVPNEEASVGTVKVEVDFKPEYAISSARTRPVPGWKAEVVKSKLPTPVRNDKGAEVTEVVSKIVWTAQNGTSIAAGSTEFQEFEISLGPLPSNVDTLELPAVQTYQGGKEVRWDQPTPAGGEEPEHPAPTVALAAEETEGGHGGHGATTAQVQTTAQAAPATDDTARWLGGIGLGVGALGLGVGAGATLRARRAGATRSSGSTE